ncbi:hypothetical protein BC834DRAFT_360683 [Gloeopeniophorella convolvens]|nr:hypothetical protein BC834DRAFT_360683 [Gloeopeniophorella convolvens]
MESSSTARRRGHPSHGRENAPAAAARPFLKSRGKSREPPRIPSDDDEPPVPRNDSHRRKKKHAAAFPDAVSGFGPRAGPSAEASAPERLSKTSKQKYNPVTHTVWDAPSAIPRITQRSKKEMPRDAKRPGKAPSVIAVSDDEAEIQTGYNGSNASMEMNRLKKELEALKKQSQTSQKTLEKQAKVISSLKSDLSSMTKNNSDNASEIKRLKTKTKQSDELISNIEGALQCQICIDTLTKPFALSPCGHVLCQGCLQDWFRNAPVTQDDMDIDEPLPLLLRKKTCPFCRTIIRTRPLPLFILKNLLSIVNKEKSRDEAGSSRPSPPPDLDDPWAEIFPPPRGDSEYDEDDEDAELSDDYWGPYDDDDDEDAGLDDDDDDAGLGDYDDTSDDGYQGEWVLPAWEPPAHRAGASLDPEPAIDMLLRRGATHGMIDTYTVEYTHDQGVAVLVDGLWLYLGWNLDLSDDDEDGERFIAWCFEDMESRPDRWRFGEDHAHRLVRVDTVQEYDSSDSENWIGEDGDEDEEDDA